MRDSKRGEGGASLRRAAQGGRPVLADPFYYLNNFKTVLTSLEERYRDDFEAWNAGLVSAQTAAAPMAEMGLAVFEDEYHRIRSTAIKDTFDRLGYAGFVGCEYRPRARTEDGLTWALPYGIAPRG